MVDTLLMSTASIIYDSNGQPYSPRKQGAGLININDAVKTEGYLTVDGMIRPKLELGDDPAEKGVYTMTFKVHNTGKDTLYYDIQPIVLTDGTTTYTNSDNEAFLTSSETAVALSHTFTTNCENNRVSVAPGKTADVTVTVTVTGGKVTNVAIDASGETPELGGAAAETLADELTKAGSTAGVDAVSGATLTSNAVFTAMDSCLAQAGTGSAGAEDLTDGTYTSSAKGCLSDVEVTVTVSGGKVSEVAIDASGETPELGGAAAETLADALTKAGSTNGVDAVSGATLTSEAVFTAMDDCLSQAQ